MLGEMYQLINVRFLKTEHQYLKTVLQNHIFGVAWGRILV